MAPLQNWEHGANAFDLDDNEDDCYVTPASFVVTADHDPRRDDGGPLGQRICWLGMEMVINHPKPTPRTPMHGDTTNAGEGASGIAG